MHIYTHRRYKLPIEARVYLILQADFSLNDNNLKLNAILFTLTVKNSKCDLRQTQHTLVMLGSHIFTQNIGITKYCQSCFNFEMPSDLWVKHPNKLNDKISQRDIMFVTRVSLQSYTLHMLY